MFGEEEENKLEYMNVYNDYVQIIENAIEGELKTTYGFSDDELDQFYE
jgi:hypothetical protein